MGRVDGKVAIVTGASGGIGSATARLLAEEGASVVATGRRRNGGGSIISVASLSTILGSVSGFAYSASRGGVAGMTKDIAWHSGPDNIRCNSIHPGPTDTPMMCAALSDPVVAGSILEQVPLRRICEPIEQVYGILYLASDESAYVTGTSLMIDGGFCIQ